MISLTPKPTLLHESDFINPFTSLALSDGTMNFVNMSFGSDLVSSQFDMDAYQMGLREYGIAPAGTH